MKKVSIITILDNFNFGTYLQAFALCKIIESIGHIPELVAYCRPGHSVMAQYKRAITTTYNPLKLLARTYYAIRNIHLRKKDTTIIRKYLTKRKYYSYQELKKNPPIADIYMTGSDQVWNSIYNNGVDKAFYLGYAPKDATLTSYGASIGMNEIPSTEKDEMVKLLSRYNNISVREDLAKDLLISIGVDKNKISHVLDPTLLLDKKQWSLYIKKSIHKFPYLLIYSVENKEQNKIISQVAYEISQRYNLKIVGVYYGNRSFRIEGCDINHYRATPEIFLSLIYYAEFVIVSSFHGTAFSINFEKEFLTISPKMFNSRITSLLKISQIENRIIHDINELPARLDPINYKVVKERLDLYRNSSIQYLQNCLN